MLGVEVDRIKVGREDGAGATPLESSQRRRCRPPRPRVGRRVPALNPLPAVVWAHPMSVILGTRLGVYEVAGKLGEGGMGEAYQARDTKLDRGVALKLLPEGGVE